MRLWKLALPLLGLVLLSGCAQNLTVATAEPACRTLTHVCVSRADALTEGTASQIEGNNLARVRLCRVKGDPCKAVRVKPAPKSVAAAPAAPAAPAPAPATGAIPQAVPQAAPQTVPMPQPSPSPIRPGQTASG